jgi:hypothetical protein
VKSSFGRRVCKGFHAWWVYAIDRSDLTCQYVHSTSLIPRGAKPMATDWECRLALITLDTPFSPAAFLSNGNSFWVRVNTR